MLLIPLLAFSKQNNYYKIQYGGNIGMFSIGFGKSFCDKKLQFDASYGYVPKDVAKNEIHTITLKTFYVPLTIKSKLANFSISPLYIGGYGSFVIGEQYKIIWPKSYPAGYYPSTGFYSSEIIGSKLTLPNILHKNEERHIHLYAELGIPNYYMHNLVVKKDIELHEVINLGLGIIVDI